MHLIDLPHDTPRRSRSGVLRLESYIDGPNGDIVDELRTNVHAEHRLTVEMRQLRRLFAATGVAITRGSCELIAHQLWEVTVGRASDAADPPVPWEVLDFRVKVRMAAIIAVAREDGVIDVPDSTARLGVS